jgi:hypothetical protein
MVGTVATSADLPPTGNTVNDCYTALDTGHGHVWDATNTWLDIGPIQGPAGPAGIQGVPGSDGKDGVVGPAGPTAVSADAGNVGVLGSDSLLFVPDPELSCLPLTGGTVTGPTLIKANFTVGSDALAKNLNLDGPAASNRWLYVQTAGSTRWALGADNSAETGTANAGSNFVIRSYGDSGGLHNIPLTINRQTGLITVLGDPTTGLGVVTLQYLTASLGGYLPKTGGNLTGMLNMSNNLIIGLKDPSNPQEAATKAYVDSAVGSGGGGGIAEAPVDGTPYSRQDAGWVPSPSGGGGGGLPLTGGTLTGPLILHADPVQTLEAATKQYVDNHPAVATASMNAPTGPNVNGQLWWDNQNGQLFIHYYDQSNWQWVAASSQNGIPEAPMDGKKYARSNGAWVEIP